MRRRSQRPRNDPGQYDDLVAEWWDPAGAFAALHWLAATRAQALPPPPRPGAVLVDVACGGGLMAPHVPCGYLHVGVDLTASALLLAAGHGITPVQGDVAALPLDEGVADVVIAGEIFEHVRDLESAVAEVARVLRPGGLLICDTINDTWLARLLLVTIGERVPGGAPPGLHDPALFVDPRRLRRLFAAHTIDLQVRGLRISLRDFVAFLRSRERAVRMPPTRSLAVLYQGIGRKAVP